MTRVNYRRTSPYADTVQTNSFLNFWEPRLVPAFPDDLLIEIEPKFDERPDLLANELYQDSGLWWVFTMRNRDLLKDPVFDLKSGLQIFVPTKTRINSIIT